jgi:FkbM family methyltransferase
MTFISYAQNFEDVILWRALKHIKNGTYIDIGAQDPVTHSVSLAFYENGWRGVHVEPNADYAEKIRKARPDEEVIQAAVGAKNGKMSFFDIPDTGLSTGDEAIAKRHEAAGFKTRRTTVNCLPFSKILGPFQKRDVHWLKIDVEGMEHAVIKGWGKSPVRPWIVVVESTKPLSTEVIHGEWEGMLKALGYDFVYFDGLNRFYVARKHKELKACFGPGPNVFDDYQHYDYLTVLTENSKLQQEIISTKIEAEELLSEFKVTKAASYQISDKLSQSLSAIDDLRLQLQKADERADGYASEISHLDVELTELGNQSKTLETRLKFIKYYNIKAQGIYQKPVFSFIRSARRLIPHAKLKREFIAAQNRSVSQSFVLGKKAKTSLLHFKNPQQSKILLFEVPTPISPAQYGTGDDKRRLGVGFMNLEIVPINSSSEARIIKFDTDSLPNFMKSISGLGKSETWGSWSSGEAVVLEFSNPLPSEFDLRIEALAFGPNVGRKIVSFISSDESAGINSALDDPNNLEKNAVNFSFKNFIMQVISRRTANPSAAEFMIDPEPEAEIAWQKLIEKNNIN